jgi:Cu(I)/Ag(I) efflux system periplasmic protein CusF
MAVAKITVASVAAILIATTSALAQVAQPGRITKIDPKGGSIGLEHPPNGQAGMGTVVDEFKVQDGLPVSKLKVGDKVSFTAAQVRGVWTVIKIQKQ